MQTIQAAAGAARERASESATDSDAGRAALERIGALLEQSGASASVLADQAATERDDVEHVAHDLNEMTASVDEIRARSTAVAADQLELSASTERASCTLVRFHTGSIVDRLHARCRGLAGELRAILEDSDRRRPDLTRRACSRSSTRRRAVRRFVLFRVCSTRAAYPRTASPRRNS